MVAGVAEEKASAHALDKVGVIDIQRWLLGDRHPEVMQLDSFIRIVPTVEKLRDGNESVMAQGRRVHKVKIVGIISKDDGVMPIFPIS